MSILENSHLRYQDIKSLQSLSLDWAWNLTVGYWLFLGSCNNCTGNREETNYFRSIFKGKWF